MSYIFLHSQAEETYTVLPNWFVDHYLPRANGEFVKVYIYLVRSLTAPGSSLGLPEMADQLQCTESDITRALLYWSREKLISLEYNAQKELTGICLAEPENIRSTLSRYEGASQTLHSQFRNAGQNRQNEYGNTSQNQQNAFERSISGNSRDLENASQESSVNYGISHPGQPTGQPDTASLSAPNRRQALTPDRVKELKESEDVQQLLFISQQYLGKPLAPSEVQKILFFYDELHMSLDLIDYLIQHCVGKGHKSLRYIETVALAWAEEGITTVEMAKDTSSRYKKDYFTILKAMGISGRNPVDTEIALMDTWLGQYGFSMELIQEACSRTIMQTGQPNFQYANGILSDWQKKGVHSLDDVKAQDAQHQKRRLEKRPSRTPAPKTTNRFNNFQQRDYDFAEFEKQLLNQ